MKSFIESSETEATEQRGDAPQDRHNPQRGLGMQGDTSIYPVCRRWGG